MSHHNHGAAHVKDNYSKATNETCGEGEAYCWMNCLPIKKCGTHQELSCFSVENNITCCSDPNEECDTMDPTCEWECSGEPDDPTGYFLFKIHSLVFNKSSFGTLFQKTLLLSSSSKSIIF